MTIVAWITVIVIDIIILIVAFGTLSDTDNPFNTFNQFKTIGFIITLVLCLIVTFGTLWYFQNTESGKRALKTQESNFNKGIERKVSVYDVEGDLIHEYKGKFDLEYDDDRILFDDENGLRHIIYYPTGTVIIDEINE